MNDFFPNLEKELLILHDNFEKRANRDEDAPLVKQAFDTRRINSETQVNPRRNLQNYQRSEPFITNDISNKIKSFFKIKVAVDLIKNQFLGDPDWLDSNSRILCNAVNNALRIEQKDYDFSKSQFDYLNELLYLRYRLTSDNIEIMSEVEIKDVLLKKDERLMYKSAFSNYNNEISKTGVDDDSLTSKLFGNVKANNNNKTVERSINITIRDSILDDGKKCL